jgi:CBS domain-containing protein
VATRAKLEEARIAEVMTNDVVTVGPATSLREAAKIMADRGSATFPWSTAGSWSQ